MADNLAPLMLGLSGPTLTEAERAFIRERKPFSFIIFARNIESESQVKKLTDELAELAATPFPLIAVDQEGGRVQRLTFGGRLPPVQVYGQWYAHNPEAALEACRLHGTLLAAELRAVGATWVLGPCLDLALPETNAIIGNRAFSENPEVVIALGQALMQGIREGGCLGCLKHAPGHGRAATDSHVEMPVVNADAATLDHDAKPFAALGPSSDFVMTAHIRYPALDAQNPATYSPTILAKMRTEWGFKGLILADDLGMHALTGPYEKRATQAMEAGCDAVIAALSVIKHGMAGTVWDEANFKVLEKADLPALSAKAEGYVRNLRLPPALTAAERAERTGRYKALWATRPAEIVATITV